MTIRLFAKVVVVTGSRNLPDNGFVESVLEALSPDRVIVGDCKTGADMFAARWAIKNRDRVRLTALAALWDLHSPRGKAGPVRNAEVAEQLADCRDRGDECVAVAFPDGPERRGSGTWDCVRQLRQWGLRAIVHQRAGGGR